MQIPSTLLFSQIANYLPFQWKKYKYGNKFVQQLSILIQAQLPLYQALQIIEDRSASTFNQAFGHCIHVIKRDIHNGIELHIAVRKWSRYFSPLTVSLLRVGAESGQLGEVLTRLSNYISRSSDYKKKFGKALIYPAVVMGVAVVTVIFLLLYLVPLFSDLLQNSGVPLPGFTQGLLSISQILSEYWYLIGLFVIGFLIFVRLPMVKKRIDRVVFHFLPKIPFWGEMAVLYFVQIYLNVLALFLKNGIPLLDGLQTCQEITSSHQMQKFFQHIIYQFKEGKPLYHILSDSPLQDSEWIALIRIGENAGELLPMFQQIARQSGEQIEQTMDTIGAALEPILIIVVGVIVGAVIIGMYLPIFSLSTGASF